MPNDSVSFSSKTPKPKQTFLDKFKALFKQSKPEKTYYNSVYKGLEEHFYTQKDSIVSEITLTSKQKKILDKKIKDFEKYKVGLDSSQLAELEKINMVC